MRRYYRTTGLIQLGPVRCIQQTRDLYKLDLHRPKTRSIHQRQVFSQLRRKVKITLPKITLRELPE